MDTGRCLVDVIYKSRNYIGLLDLEHFAVCSKIYKSRNYIGLLDCFLSSKSLMIYKSRNYIGLLDLRKWIKLLLSTKVEII